ncbi:hypothetical protein ACFW5X_08530 [Streptomyces albogriseolus]|uniref:hypothetical protein n=1 Tax=Streptomyces albogriseolus TaxID=1887 RepID=UPI0036B9BABC
MRRVDGRPGPGDDVEAVLDELYALPPSEFVARREERAARARTRRRAQDARRIHAARRPTLAGWAANLLRRSRPDEARRFLELGRALREAYATLDPSGLKELSAQRRRIVSEMSRQAAALAREAGHPLSDTVQRDVETTLRAVLADPEAAAVWEAGRVEGVLTPPSEFGAEVVAAAPARREPARARTSGTDQAARKKQDEAAERRRAEREERAARAREEARAAEARLRERRAAREEAAAALERADEQERKAGEREAALEEQLARARTEQERTRAALGEARERDRAAAEELAEAEREAASAARRAGRAERDGT